MGIPVRVGVLVAAVGGGRLPARDATASTPFAFLLEDVKIGASGSAEPASILESRSDVTGRRLHRVIGH
jgi:hypothetical protein